MAVFHDPAGLEITCASQAAADAWRDTLDGYLTNRNDTSQRLKRAITEDGEFCMAYALRGIFAMMAYKSANLGYAQKCLADARRFSSGANARELAHLSALESWIAGELDATMSNWIAIMRQWPRDILAFRLHHFMGFWLGRPEDMLAAAERTIAHFSDADFGAGAIHACRAFAHEESGSYAAAESCGWRALQIDRGDIWAAHAIAHVYEMQARRSEGLALFEQLRNGWAGSNNLLHHLWWHAAMFHAERGEKDAAMELYDREFRNLQSELTLQMPDLYIDMQNAISMLWRLETQGVDGGARWDELADKAQTLKGDCSNPFTLPHHVMALLRAGRLDATREYIDAMKNFAADPQLTLQLIVRDAAIPFCEGLLADARGKPAQALDLMRPSISQWPRLGGSHAQQDVLHQVYAKIAQRAQSQADIKLITERVRARRGMPLETFAAWRNFTTA